MLSSTIIMLKVAQESKDLIVDYFKYIADDLPVIGRIRCTRKYSIKLIVPRNSVKSFNRYIFIWFASQVEFKAMHSALGSVTQ